MPEPTNRQVLPSDYRQVQQRVESLRRQEKAGRTVERRYRQDIVRDARVMSVYLRTWQGVARHARDRGLEWFLGAVLLNWGLYVVLQGEIVGQSKAFTSLVSYFPMSVWGFLAIAAGGGRLIALVVNGSFANTPLFKYAPYGRIASAFSAQFFWVQISLSLYAAGVPITAINWYVAAIVADFWNLFQTAGDVRKYREAGLGPL